MAAPTSFRPPRAGRRGRGREQSNGDQQAPFRRQLPTWIVYLGAAMLGMSLLQMVIGPLLPRPAEIPYSEFKTKLAAGQIIDVTLGSPIKGVMKNPGCFRCS